MTQGIDVRASVPRATPAPARPDVTRLHDLRTLRVRADELCVLGVGLGDSIERLAERPLYVTHPDEDPRWARHVLAGHGWVRASREVALEVEAGRIRAIALTGTAVAGCEVEAARDVLRALGPPAGLSWRLGAQLFHYPTRQLRVLWHPGQRRLLCVTLGRFEWREPEHGARELLHELSEHLLAVRRPRTDDEHARRARVNALARALGYASIDVLLEGELRETSWRVHARVLEEMRSEHRPELVAGCDAAQVFTYLLGVYLLTRPRDTHRVGSSVSGVTRAVSPTEPLPREGHDERAQVEGWLAAMIDPSGRRIPEHELVQGWGWPDLGVEVGLRRSPQPGARQRRGVPPPPPEQT